MEGKTSPLVFNEWLKRRRKALDMTQDELAQRAGCSVGALRKIESGDRRPSKQLALLLAKALEIPDQDQQTFLRVARGEYNLERLQGHSLETQGPFPELWSQRGTHPSPALNPRLAPLSSRLPLQPTPLIGRQVELAALERLFNDPQCRLLTLTGMGGIGKTRLAIEFGARKLPAFPGGVFYFPLTPVNSPEKIVPAIADVLDFGFSGPGDLEEQLFNYLSSNIKGEALFILDNLEHLLLQPPAQEDDYDVAELISEILGRMPNVKILGTSRERLNLHGEWTYELHGLTVPQSVFVGRLEDYNSIALFVNSARRIQADFEVTDKCQAELIQISQLVEGVPLAIELAAAWVGVLSCQEIAQEIQSNMDFLTTSLRDIPERHRSMRAAFDHSWNLLTDEERKALCQLAVFQGGFDRTAAEQIAGATLPLLASLSAKSLVRRSENGRYDLHEVIRQYALSHLQDHPRNNETYQRHCEYYLKMVWEREKSLKSAAQQEAVRQLTDDIDNIRAAWACAVEHNSFSLLGRAGRGFGWYFEITGLYREGIEQLELLMQVLNDEPQDDQRRRILGLMYVHRALLHFRIGEFDHARGLYAESVHILRPVGDSILLADALIFLGILQHLMGEYERARASVEEGLLFARESQAGWYEAYAIYNLGYIASLMGRYEEGYEQMMEGLGIWRAIGDPHYIALGLNFLVPTLNQLGRYDEAKTLMQESIALCEQSKNRWGMGTAYRFLGVACIAKGQYAEAQAHLMKSLEIYGEFVVGYDLARSLTFLGDATLLSGQLTEARKIYREALRLSIEAKLIPIALDALLGLSCLEARAPEAQAHQTDHALMLCYYVLNHPASEDETKSRAEQLRATLEPRVSPEQVQSVRALAQGNTLDSIVKEALE